MIENDMRAARNMFEHMLAELAASRIALDRLRDALGEGFEDPDAAVPDDAHGIVQAALDALEGERGRADDLAAQVRKLEEIADDAARKLAAEQWLEEQHQQQRREERQQRRRREREKIAGRGCTAEQWLEDTKEEAARLVGAARDALQDVEAQIRGQRPW